MRLSPASLLPFLTLAVLPTAADAAGPAPRHPVSLRASTGDHSVVLHWRAAKNLKRIRIYRRRQGHNWLRTPIATVEGSTRTYVDRGLHNGRRYYYRLRAVGRNGRYSKVSRSTTVRVRSLKTKRTTPRKGTPIPGSGSSPSPLTAPGGRAPSTTPSGTAAGAAPVIPPLALGDPWSWDARSAALDPDNATLSARLVPTSTRANLALSDWAVATADAKAGDLEYSIPASQQGGSITLRIPLGTRPDPSRTTATSRSATSSAGIETDFWQAAYDSATGRISSTGAAVQFPLNAVNLGPRAGPVTPRTRRCAADWSRRRT